MNYTLDDYDPDADFDAWYTDETGRLIQGCLDADSVLEIGCATGRMTQYLVCSGRRVLALTLDEGMARRAQARDLPGVTVVRKNVLTLGYRETFDAIVCCLVLHEVLDVQAMMGKAYDLLAPGGRVFVTVPSANSIHLISGESARAARFGVRRLWTPERWDDELIRMTGLRVVDRFEMMLKPYPNDRMACLTPAVLDHLAAYRGPGGTLCYFELERAN